MSETTKETLKRLFVENDLQKEDVFKHQHYTIIKRQGIDKIQAKNNIEIQYEVIKCERDFAVVKALGTLRDKQIETFGSALKGDFKSGNSNTWYIMEMAEKRAMSRAVLKLSGLYALGVMGQDESEDFKE
jgi:hypothetical protein